MTIHASIIIRGKQIKTTVRYHYQDDYHQKKQKPAHADEDVEKWQLSALWVGMQNGASAMETGMEVPKN